MKKAILMRRAVAQIGSGSSASLLPANVEAEAVLSQVPLGETIQVKLDRSRSNPQNRLYWGIISHVAAGAGYETDRSLHQALKVALGHYDVVRLPSGKALACPRSTSFDAMPADEFQTYMDGAIRLICSEIIPGTNSDDLIREVQAMLGDPPLLPKLRPLPTCPEKHVCYDAQQCQGKCGVDHERRTSDDGFVHAPKQPDPAHRAPESPQVPKAPIIAPGGDKLPLDPMESEIVRLLQERLEKQ